MQPSLPRFWLRVIRLAKNPSGEWMFAEIVVLQTDDVAFGKLCNAADLQESMSWNCPGLRVSTTVLVRRRHANHLHLGGQTLWRFSLHLEHVDFLERQHRTLFFFYLLNRERAWKSPLTHAQLQSLKGFERKWKELSQLVRYPLVCAWYERHGHDWQPSPLAWCSHLDMFGSCHITEQGLTLWASLVSQPG